jgi:hypothetical protein
MPPNPGELNPKLSRIGGAEGLQSAADADHVVAVLTDIVIGLVRRSRAAQNVRQPGQYDDVAAASVAVEVQRHPRVCTDVLEPLGVWTVVDQQVAPSQTNQTGLGCGVPSRPTVVSQTSRSSCRR